MASVIASSTTNEKCQAQGGLSIKADRHAVGAPYELFHIVTLSNDGDRKVHRNWHSPGRETLKHL